MSRHPSSLYRTSGQPLHDPPLKNKNHRRDRRSGDDRRSENLAPGYLVLPTEQRDRDGDCLPLRSERERQREQKLVPAVDERQDARRRQARDGKRKENPRKALS